MLRGEASRKLDWAGMCWLCASCSLGGSSAIIDLMEHHQETHFQEHGILIIQDRWGKRPESFVIRRSNTIGFKNSSKSWNPWCLLSLLFQCCLHRDNLFPINIEDNLVSHSLESKFLLKIAIVMLSSLIVTSCMSQPLKETHIAQAIKISQIIVTEYRIIMCVIIVCRLEVTAIWVNRCQEVWLQLCLSGYNFG